MNLPKMRCDGSRYRRRRTSSKDHQAHRWISLPTANHPPFRSLIIAVAIAALTAGAVIAAGEPEPLVLRGDRTVIVDGTAHAGQYLQWILLKCVAKTADADYPSRRLWNPLSPLTNLSYPYLKKVIQSFY